VIQKGGLIRFGYNLLFAAFFWLSAPFYLLKMVRRGNWRRGFAQRFGIYDEALRSQLRESGPVVWMHAVSVGEINQCVPLQQALEKVMPGRTWVISTTTSTGMAELQTKLPEQVLKIYYPADFAGAVRRSLNLIRPRMIVLVEAEVWPNMMWAAADRQIPVALVNARLSERSFHRYRQVAFLFAPLFESLSAVGAQTEGEVELWCQLGCKSGRIVVTKNMKFDSVDLEPPGKLDVRALLDRLGVGRDSKIIVGGSTHDGEEAILARVMKRLRSDGLDVFLVIVPRHMERGRAVLSHIQEQGLRARRRSQLNAADCEPDLDLDCLIVDTTGELIDCYAAADVVFIGKSLKKGGGQNPIEPAALGKAVLYGDKMGNFKDISHILVSEGAAVAVSGEGGLQEKLHEILLSTSKNQEMGKAASRCVTENRGSLRRTVQMIQKITQKTIDPTTDIS